MQKPNVVIVGGGLAGLYFAYRLASSTSNTVCLFEYNSRFGGRYETCKMPGDFPADMGAMRYLSHSQPMIHKLISDMGLSTEKLFINDRKKKNTVIGYFRNKRVTSLDELRRIYSVSDEDLPYFFPSDIEREVVVPNDGNFYNSIVIRNGELARNMALSEYVAQSRNVELINFGDPHYPLSITVADELAYENLFGKDPVNEYLCIKGGMELLIKELLNKLAQLPNVKLFSSTPVERIEELGKHFVVKSKSMEVTCDKLILACNSRGIEYISWNSPFNRPAQLQAYFSQVVGVNAFKLFLTYETPWWEDYGLYCGYITTDNTLGSVNAFGDRGHANGYYTLLACFTYNYTEIFEGLNLSSAVRFQNKVGDVPTHLQPSARLVNYVQEKLGAVFGCNVVPEPVCAAARIWSSDPISSANYHARIGVDSNALNWKSLKPFPDVDVFMTGDTFLACTAAGSYIGWSESVLITSERILCNYFGLKPFISDFALHNPWESRSKL